MKWLLALLAALWLAPAWSADGTSTPSPPATIQSADDSEVDLGVVEVQATALPPREEPLAPEAQTLQTIAQQLGASTAVTVIDGDAVRDAPSTADALERVAGADVRRSGGSGQLDTITLRGSRAQQVLVLLDGAPLMPGQTADLALLPADNIERVEVLRGPEAARFGAGALGGVVNVVTRQNTEGSELTTRAGGHGQYEINLSGDADSWDWHASQFSAGNDYSFTRQAGGRAVRQNDDAQRQQLWLHHTDDDGGQVRIGLSQLERGVPGSDEFPTLRARLQRDNLWLQTQRGDTLGDVSIQQTHFSDPQPYLNQGPLDARDTRVHAELACGALALKPRSFGARPRLDWISSSDYGVHLRGGLDIGWFGASPECHKLRQYWDLGASASSDVGVDPLARYALSYTLSRSSDAYVSAGYAVRHPDFEELYLAHEGSVEGNPDLRPERVQNYEAGLRAHGARWSFDGSAFYSAYDDSIIFAPVSAYLVRAINTGRATVAGAEADFALDLSDSLSWNTSATWLPTAQLASGLPLPARARQHLSSTLAWQHAGWRTSATADYSGAMTADLFGSLHIDPRTTVDFDAWRELDGDNELGVQVTNAFNVNTRDAWHYPLPGREVFLTWRTKL